MFSDYFLSLWRQQRDVAHGVHRKTSPLARITGLPDLKEVLDICPSEWLNGEDVGSPARLQVVSQTRHEQIFFVLELRIEA